MKDNFTFTSREFGLIVTCISIAQSAITLGLVRNVSDTYGPIELKDILSLRSKFDELLLYKES